MHPLYMLKLWNDDVHIPAISIEDVVDRRMCDNLFMRNDNTRERFAYGHPVTTS